MKAVVVARSVIVPVMCLRMLEMVWSKQDFDFDISKVLKFVPKL